MPCRVEPSSALATRIVCAHDNPSPPPKSPVDSGPPTPDIYPAHPIPFTIPNSPSLPSRGGSLRRLSLSPHDNLPQHDLISFDSFAAFGDLPPTNPIASTSFTPPKTHIPSVDELLTSWSPSAREAPAPSVSPAPSESDTSKGKGRMSDESTPDAEERAVVEAMVVPEAADADQNTYVTSRDTDNDTDTQTSSELAYQASLRRSTRPRGSTPAHLIPLPNSDDESPLRAHLTPSSARAKTRIKGKETVLHEISDPHRDGSVTSGGTLPSEDHRRRERAERKQGSALGTSPLRQLGSLSPGSANLLTQLLSTSTPSPAHEQEVEAQFTGTVPVFPVADPSHTTPAPVTSPIRVSPARSSRPRSPNRIHFEATSLNDPNRTPARRIPVEQAVARGQISPQKAAQLLAHNTDVVPFSRTPVFHIPPHDSPARRVHVAPPTPGQGKWQGMRFGSPTRGKSRERSGSPEQRPPGNVNVATAGSSNLGASASTSQSILAPMKKRKLPFPLTPSGSERPVLVPKLDDKIPTTNIDSPEQPAPPPSSPVLSIIKIPRSNLKQPTSRIPRIGTKPYARPTAKPTTSVKAAKAVAVPPIKAAETAKVPSQTINVAKTVRRSSSDDIKATEAGPHTLKRKRTPSPQNRQRPVVLLRKVAQTKPPPRPVSAQSSPSPVKRAPVAKFRMVDMHIRRVDAADAKLPEPVAGPPALDALLPPSSSSPPSPLKRPPVAKFRMVDMHAHPVDAADAKPGPEEPPAGSEFILPDALRSSSPVVPPSIPPSPLPPDVPHVPEESVRRTTRVRKTVFSAAVVPQQPLPGRRRAVSQQQPSGSGAFAGMSAVALKALTSLNTTKNQRYVAAKLETEVVRKEGKRPESPVMKIKTVAQREQEARGARRRERATRRARRSGDDGLSENEGLSDGGDSSVVDDTDMDSSPVRRHQRGPGDEEDYETPMASGVKRVRSESRSGEEGQAEKKRVKWHGGLATAVYLDEVEPRPWARPKENVAGLKGCLAPTAKALRLDTLGNYLNCESPLKDLKEENIVIKKFVYDSDEPILPVIVVKNTRSKAKKKS
ncbi:hypothetical protein GGX14DRAFT_435345 [Mycena pura]|uniref:Uncharacterized protein n=1 Tax=Mycena pura TaxID=153505 RepID=A0AAD6YKC1_9AGAR|nr:hypothetical protein GGX14DRAFT_435345 [Mycena pura]